MKKLLPQWFKKGQKAWNKGIDHLSPEAKKRIGLANKRRFKLFGHPKGMLGKKHSAKTIAKLKKWRPTEEQKKKMIHKGRNHPMWLGPRLEIRCSECKKKLLIRPNSTQKFCSRRCVSKHTLYNYWLNRPRKIVQYPRCKKCKIALKTRRSKTGKCKICLTKKGKNHPWWKGGVTNIQKAIRGSSKYIKWRNDIFLRDDYTCLWCKKRGGKLNVDHYPIELSRIIKDYKIKNLVQAKKRCVILWDLDNGRTLCVECHKKTPTYAKGLRPPFSKEHKMKIANFSKGRKHTEESKKKMSSIKKNWWLKIKKQHETTK